MLVPLLAGRRGDLLEVGSGTGEHAAALAPVLPGLRWWPTDPDPDQRASIDAHAADAMAPNLRPACALDAAADWPLGEPGVPPTPLAAIFSANVLHISPWAVTEGLLRNAARHLAAEGLLILYGPFALDGRHTGPGNADFDASLRQRNPAWGVRDLTVVAALAAAWGLVLTRSVPMPADNMINLFARAGSPVANPGEGSNA